MSIPKTLSSGEDEGKGRVKTRIEVLDLFPYLSRGMSEQWKKPCYTMETEFNESTNGFGERKNGFDVN